MLDQYSLQKIADATTQIITKEEIKLLFEQVYNKLVTINLLENPENMSLWFVDLYSQGIFFDFLNKIADLAKDQQGELALKIIGTVLLVKGHTQQASMIFKYRYRLLKTFPQLDYRALGASSRDLGVIAEKQGLIQDSIKYYQDALEFLHQAIQPNQYEIALTKQYLGALLCQINNVSEGISLLKEALEIFTSTLGETHEVTINAKHNLYSILINIGNYFEALYYARQLFFTYQNMWGENNHQTLVHLLNVGVILRKIAQNTHKQEDYEEAYKVISHLYELHQKSPTPDTVQLTKIYKALERLKLEMASLS